MTLIGNRQETVQNADQLRLNRIRNTRQEVGLHGRYRHHKYRCGATGGWESAGCRRKEPAAKRSAKKQERSPKERQGRNFCFSVHEKGPAGATGSAEKSNLYRSHPLKKWASEQFCFLAWPLAVFRPAVVSCFFFSDSPLGAIARMPRAQKETSGSNANSADVFWLCAAASAAVFQGGVDFRPNALNADLIFTSFLA
jgi:hypothetical protein